MECKIAGTSVALGDLIKMSQWVSGFIGKRELAGRHVSKQAIDFAHSHVALVRNQAEGTLVEPRLGREARADERRHSTTSFSKKATAFTPLSEWSATTSMNRKKPLALNGVRSSPNVSALITALLWDCLQHSELFFFQ